MVKKGDESKKNKRDYDQKLMTVKLPKKFYGEKIEEYMEKNPGLLSRADAVREILRKYFKKEE